MAELKQIVIDCERAAPLARFWAAVLDSYEVLPYDEDEIARLAELGLTPDTDPNVIVIGDGPELCFQEVPEKKSEKIRMHFDIVAEQFAGEIERLRGLGATVVEEYESRTLMRDPEGNEFCVNEGHAR